MEGLVRQIIGFREYTRMMYITQHDFLSTTNFLEHSAKVPQAFYSGGTGLIPIDVGSAMTMLGISPTEMYKWFLEFSIDAYP